eukprot:TRINITY_DN9551_c0_g1_i1.p1 TRINITY_DN9551_c0_g1~~TRINITY_DN9551_c0_g1_i1.p1  ORF type:complete len:432 (-),score=114.93 TRINITY_DN9551_c0_g1_i1:37-1332(-)
MGGKCSCSCTSMRGDLIDNQQPQSQKIPETSRKYNHSRPLLFDGSDQFRRLISRGPLLQDPEEEENESRGEELFADMMNKVSQGGEAGFLSNPTELESEAYFRVAFCYEKGYEDVKQDFYQARIWYRKAADKLHAKAMLRLGKMYQKGKGGDVNLEKALYWYKESANLPEAPQESLFRVGWFYEQGIVVEQSYFEAYIWYMRAAQGAHPVPDAVYKLGSFYFEGRGVVHPDETAAVQWFKRSAVEFSDPRGMHKLGMCYEKGIGVEKNEEQALAWYKEAFHGYKHLAENEQSPDKNATYEIAIFYLEGKVVPRNEEAAFNWFSKSAMDFRDHRGMYRLGYCLENGIGCEVHLKRAAEWYSEAAKLENTSALNRLAGMYEKGKFFVQDLDKAENLRKMAEDIMDERRVAERRKRLTQISDSLDDEIVGMATD